MISSILSDSKILGLRCTFLFCNFRPLYVFENKHCALPSRMRMQRGEKGQSPVEEADIFTQQACPEHPLCFRCPSRSLGDTSTKGRRISALGLGSRQKTNTSSIDQVDGMFKGNIPKTKCTKWEVEPSKGTKERCEVNIIQLLWPQSGISQGMCLIGL